jgi:hypothetical protein
MRIWIRNTAFFLEDLRCADWDTEDLRGFEIPGLKIYGFAICGLAHLRNLRNCDCRMSQKIVIFAIYGLTKKFACPFLVCIYRKVSAGQTAYLKGLYQSWVGICCP